ncbi:acetate--CoA ligase family protein [Desulfothermus sp.]
MENKRIINHPLNTILNPDSIAFVGASSDISKPGALHLLSLIGTFKGKIYPIHPRERQILGLRAYSSIKDLPEIVDLLVVMVPNASVPKLLMEAGEKGIKHAIIITAGYSEMGDKGQELQKEINEIAHKYNIRFLGPNCIGAVNPENGLNTTFFAIKNSPGHLGIISQSGSFITQTLHYFSKIGLGISKAISVGNQANIDLVDCLEYLGEDPNTHAIALYIEGIKRVREFLEIAKRIVSKKPVMAVYAGGTQAGARASISHTAALSGKDELYDGLFKQAGIIRADSIIELFDMGLVLSTQPCLENNRICIITNSGGPGACLADQCERQGLVVPQLSEDTQKIISKITPSISSLKNPIDITMSFNYETLIYKLPKIIFERENIGGIIIYGLFGPMHMRDKINSVKQKVKEIPGEMMEFMDQLCIQACDRLIHLKKRVNKPIILSSLTGPEDPAIKYLQDNNVPVILGMKRAVLCLKALWVYNNIKKILFRI